MAATVSDVQQLQDFERRSVCLDGITRDVLVSGHGPPVVVLHEIPGVHPGVLAFARRLRARGHAVYLPSLVGVPGEGGGAGSMARALGRLCVAREFTLWATAQSSAIVVWLRALAALASQEQGGLRVGVVGMCFTGGFGLAMLTEPCVVAPVLSQPSLPLPLGPRRAEALGLDAATAASVAARCHRERLDVLGLRFTGDPLVPAARFAALAALLGERFVAVELDSSPGNPHGIRRLAHSVLTLDYVDTPSHPTALAMQTVEAFLASRLGLA